jgi:hypothetical protein
VHGHDGPRARRDERFQEPLVQIQRVGPDIGEYGARAAQNEGVDGGNRRERRDDYLVAGHIEQQRRQFQGVSARRGQQRLRHAQFALQEGMTCPAVRTIARAMAETDGIRHVQHLAR